MGLSTKRLDYAFGSGAGLGLFTLVGGVNGGKLVHGDNARYATKRKVDNPEAFVNVKGEAK